MVVLPGGGGGGEEAFYTQHPYIYAVTLTLKEYE
jgi:hypothetical protein